MLLRPLPIALLALCAAAWLPAGTAHACKCKPLTPADAFTQAQRVFEGRVIEVREVGTPREGMDHEVTLAVVRAWKGIDAERAVLRTASSGAACGVTFTADTSYLIYARESDGVPSVSLCSRTKPMSEAAEDLAALDMGATPVDPNADPLPAEPKQEPPARGGCAGCTVGAARSASGSVLFALLIGAGFLASRTRRRS